MQIIIHYSSFTHSSGDLYTTISLTHSYACTNDYLPCTYLHDQHERTCKIAYIELLNNSRFMESLQNGFLLFYIGKVLHYYVWLFGQYSSE